MADSVTYVPTKKWKRGKPRRTPRTVKGKVSKLQSEVSAIKKATFQTVEKKCVFSTLDPTVIDWSGVISTPLNVITQGDGVNERIGRTVKCNGIDFRYRVKNVLAASQPQIRVIIYLDKKNILPTVSDVLNNDAGLGLNSIRATMAFYNRNNRGDFIVLHDKTHDFDFTSGNFQQAEKFSLKTNHLLKFTGDTTTIAENSVRVLIISDQAVAAASRPSIEFQSCYYYTDA